MENEFLNENNNIKYFSNDKNDTCIKKDEQNKDHTLNIDKLNKNSSSSSSNFYIDNCKYKIMEYLKNTTNRKSENAFKITLKSFKDYDKIDSYKKNFNNVKNNEIKIYEMDNDDYLKKNVKNNDHINSDSNDDRSNINNIIKSINDHSTSSSYDSLTFLRRNFESYRSSILFLNNKKKSLKCTELNNNDTLELHKDIKKKKKKKKIAVNFDSKNKKSNMHAYTDVEKLKININNVNVNSYNSNNKERIKNTKSDLDNAEKKNENLDNCNKKKTSNNINVYSVSTSNFNDDYLNKINLINLNKTSNENSSNGSNKSSLNNHFKKRKLYEDNSEKPNNNSSENINNNKDLMKSPETSRQHPSITSSSVFSSFFRFPSSYLSNQKRRKKENKYAPDIVEGKNLSKYEDFKNIKFSNSRKSDLEKQFKDLTNCKKYDSNDSNNAINYTNSNNVNGDNSSCTHKNSCKNLKNNNFYDIFSSNPNNKGTVKMINTNNRNVFFVNSFNENYYYENINLKDSNLLKNDKIHNNLKYSERYYENYILFKSFIFSLNNPYTFSSISREHEINEVNSLKYKILKNEKYSLLNNVSTYKKFDEKYFLEDFITNDFQWIELDGVNCSYAYDFAFFDKTDKYMISIDALDDDNKNIKKKCMYESLNENWNILDNAKERKKKKNIKDDIFFHNGYIKTKGDNENYIYNNEKNKTIQKSNLEKNTSDMSNKNNCDLDEIIKEKDISNKECDLHENEKNFLILYAKILNISFIYSANILKQFNHPSINLFNTNKTHSLKKKEININYNENNYNCQNDYYNKEISNEYTKKSRISLKQGKKKKNFEELNKLDKKKKYKSEKTHKTKYLINEMDIQKKKNKFISNKIKRHLNCLNVRVIIKEWYIDYGIYPNCVPYIYVVSQNNNRYRLDKPLDKYYDIFTNVRLKFEITTRILKTLQVYPHISYDKLIGYLTLYESIKKKIKMKENEEKIKNQYINNIENGNQIKYENVIKNRNSNKNTIKNEDSKHLFKITNTSSDEQGNKRYKDDINKIKKKKKENIMKNFNLSEKNGTGIYIMPDGTKSKKCIWGAAYSVYKCDEHVIINLYNFLKKEIKLLEECFNINHLLNTSFMKTLKEKFYSEQKSMKEKSIDNIHNKDDEYYKISKNIQNDTGEENMQNNKYPHNNLIKNDKKIIIKKMHSGNNEDTLKKNLNINKMIKKKKKNNNNNNSEYNNNELKVKGKKEIMKRTFKEVEIKEENMKLSGEKCTQDIKENHKNYNIENENFNLIENIKIQDELYTNINDKNVYPYFLPLHLIIPLKHEMLLNIWTFFYTFKEILDINITMNNLEKIFLFKRNIFNKKIIYQSINKSYLLKEYIKKNKILISLDEMNSEGKNINDSICDIKYKDNILKSLLMLLHYSLLIDNIIKNNFRRKKKKQKYLIKKKNNYVYQIYDEFENPLINNFSNFSIKKGYNIDRRNTGMCLKKMRDQENIINDITYSEQNSQKNVHLNNLKQTGIQLCAKNPTENKDMELNIKQEGCKSDTKELNKEDISNVEKKIKNDEQKKQNFFSNDSHSDNIINFSDALSYCSYLESSSDDIKKKEYSKVNNEIKEEKEINNYDKNNDINLCKIHKDCLYKNNFSKEKCKNYYKEINYDRTINSCNIIKKNDYLKSNNKTKENDKICSDIEETKDGNNCKGDMNKEIKSNHIYITEKLIAINEDMINQIENEKNEMEELKENEKNETEELKENEIKEKKIKKQEEKIDIDQNDLENTSDEINFYDLTEYEQTINNNSYINVLSDIFLQRKKKKMIFEEYHDIRILDNITWTILLKKYIFIILYTMKHSFYFDNKNVNEKNNIIINSNFNCVIPSKNKDLNTLNTNLSISKSETINKNVKKDNINISKCYDKGNNIKNNQNNFTSNNEKNLENINLKKYKLSWFLNFSKFHFSKSEIMEMINIFKFLCKENNTYEMLKETEKMKIIMFFINIITSSNISREFINEKIEYLNNIKNYIVNKQNIEDTAQKNIKKNSNDTKIDCLFTKTIPNKEFSMKSDCIYFEEKEKKVTCEKENIRDENAKNTQGKNKGKEIIREKKNYFNKIKENFNVRIDLLGEDRYFNKYYYFGSSFGYIDRIYVQYMNHIKTNDEEHFEESAKNKLDHNDNNKCKQIKTIFNSIEEYINFINESKYNLKMGYIEGIDNINMFIERFSPFTIREIELKKKFLEIKEVIISSQLKNDGNYIKKDIKDKGNNIILAEEENKEQGNKKESSATFFNERKEDLIYENKYIHTKIEHKEQYKDNENRNSLLIKNKIRSNLNKYIHENLSNCKKKDDVTLINGTDKGHTYKNDNSNLRIDKDTDQNDEKIMYFTEAEKLFEQFFFISEKVLNFKEDIKNILSEYFESEIDKKIYDFIFFCIDNFINNELTYDIKKTIFIKYLDFIYIIEKSFSAYSSYFLQKKWNIYFRKKWINDLNFIKKEIINNTVIFNKLDILPLLNIYFNFFRIYGIKENIIRKLKKYNIEENLFKKINYDCAAKNELCIIEKFFERDNKNEKNPSNSNDDKASNLCLKERVNELRNKIYTYLPFEKNEKYFYFKEGHLEHMNKFNDHNFFNKKDDLNSLGNVEQIEVLDIKIFLISNNKEAAKEKKYISKKKNEKKDKKNENLNENDNNIKNFNDNNNDNENENEERENIIKNKKKDEKINNCSDTDNIQCNLQKNKTESKKKSKMCKKLNKKMRNDNNYCKLHNDLFQIKKEVEKQHLCLNDKKNKFYFNSLTNFTTFLDNQINDSLFNQNDLLIYKNENLLVSNNILYGNNLSEQTINNNLNETYNFLCQLHCSIIPRNYEIADSLHKKLNLSKKNLSNDIVRNPNFFLFNIFYDENMKTILYIISAKKVLNSLNNKWKIGLKCKVQKPLCSFDYSQYFATIKGISFNPMNLWKSITVKKDTKKNKKNSITQKVNFWELIKKNDI
ncbi:conserved Plasmodium protein, unknown function [Plasmodium relictum]|uniref:Chloroquine resistance marker protein n=1 Tax=Plasmodium relictum TaxID=85471 RepID=A0A1J1H8Z4_PLARL|nr:conserved Plasmodium protein, unknown function [Plasmodium relictum]CRH01441.1 conserved Plasmodium protein, unknown function [Plasmodium relictum]